MGCTAALIHGAASARARRRRWRRLSWCFALALVVSAALWSAGPARAASSVVEVESLIRHGVELRRQGQDERALPLFQQAYELARNPRTAAQLGLCELSTGYWIDAEQHLAEALVSAEHPWVAKNRQQLAASLERARANIGELTVTGTPVGAEVRVNGKVAGQLPLGKLLRLARGPVDVEVRAPGYVATNRSLVIGDRSQTLEVALSPERKTPVAQVSALPEPTGPPEISTSPPAAHLEGGAPDRRGHALRWAAIGTGGVAVAALIFGGIETMRWQSGVKDYNNHQTNGAPDCQTIATDRGGSDCLRIFNQYTSAKRLAVIGYVGGGALTLATVGLVMFSSQHSTEAERVGLACAPTLVGNGVSCRISF